MLATSAAATSPFTDHWLDFLKSDMAQLCALVLVAFADLLQHIEEGLPQEWHQHLAESKAGAVEPRRSGSKHRPYPISHGLKIINATGDTKIYFW